MTTRLVSVVHVVFVTGALVHMVLVCAQPFLAGWSLDGDGVALELHGTNGNIIFTISMLLIPLSILCWRPGRGSLWGPILTTLLFVAETFQLNMGYADILIVHIPLGVGIVLGSVILFALALRQRRRAFGPAPKRRVMS